MATRRALHFVFKIGDRKTTTKFFRDILGMKVLRHEEFEEGCKASCNGPYEGKWSKTMIGYGAEDNHFVCELTYNYGISKYPLGNDFIGMYIESSEAIARAKACSYPFTQDNEKYTLESPDGYKFHILNKPQPTDADPVKQICLGSSSIEASLLYWKDLLNMNLHSRDESSAILSYSPDQARLMIQDIGGKVDHAKAFGRIAFSCPASELPGIESKIKEMNHTILTPYVSLDTPGKATVQVVILADPDGHEICFVGDEGFRELSAVDPEADNLLNEAMEADKSDEWFAKEGGKSSA